MRPASVLRALSPVFACGYLHTYSLLVTWVILQRTERLTFLLAASISVSLLPSFTLVSAATLRGRERTNNSSQSVVRDHIFRSPRPSSTAGALVRMEI
ncbi:hypothetical protein A0H81_14331 [Grifola frondosa]|uniref:Uncharacterized protein n=1 Tax=Grifola frondosa TaxID=5627 RepID=A0A1C7LLZ6_GRIFR|nr:hypothetical protein A0H81_14331 [Grifola frondosa]